MPISNRSVFLRWSTSNGPTSRTAGGGPARLPPIPIESFSVFGFRVHKPWGPRKSGIPDSVEMPAPVNATTRRDCSTHSPAISNPLSIELHSTKNALQRSTGAVRLLDGSGVRDYNPCCYGSPQEFGQMNETFGGLRGSVLFVWVH